mmetsp:Transcript_68937/g.183657  ORF Transcript_68937/g.183657 Transcript_68937/m.183657 type:complete len:283 (-) Transcript_68937:178-1026(-)
MLWADISRCWHTGSTISNVGDICLKKPFTMATALWKGSVRYNPPNDCAGSVNFAKSTRLKSSSFMSYNHLSMGPPFTFSIANHSLQLSDSLLSNRSPTYNGIFGLIRPRDSVPIFKHLASNNASGSPVPAVFPISFTAMLAWASSCPSRFPSHTEPKLPTPSSFTNVTNNPSLISILIFGRRRLGRPVESIPLSGGFTSACFGASTGAACFSSVFPPVSGAGLVAWPLAAPDFWGLSATPFCLGLAAGAGAGVVSGAFWGLAAWVFAGLATASFCGLATGSF